MRGLVRSIVVLALFTWMAGIAKAVATCSVSTSGEAFGNYDSIGGQERDTLGTITVTCSGTIGDTVNDSISLTSGSGSYSQRSLSGPSTGLDYNLYTDSSRTVVWGDGTNGTQTLSDGFVLSSSTETRQYTVYGRIPAGQTQCPVGTYNDSIIVTLTY
jgi:spore coat protein U-like protein